LKFLDRSNSSFAIFETESNCLTDTNRYNFLTERSSQKAYFIFALDVQTIRSLAVGWSTYNSSGNKEIKKNLGRNFKNVNYKILGLSEKNPIKSNKYEKTRKANRRVEITITQ